MAVAKQNGDVIPFVKQKDYIMVNNDLGGGSFGKTVLLQDPFIDELFVAKKYEPEYDGIKEQFYKNFLDEIKILYKLNHRNIVRIYNYYAYENIYTGYILMEYIDGENIGDFIQYNLSGNVFMISDETRNNKQDVYLDKLKSGIPDQHLSLVQDLKPKHKKRIIEILLSGSSVIDKYNDDQPEEEYIMMRKFGLILLKDILHDNDSLIQQEFRKYMKDGDEEKIKNIFSQYTPIIDSDINISLCVLPWRSQCLFSSLGSSLVKSEKPNTEFERLSPKESNCKCMKNVRRSMVSSSILSAIFCSMDFIRFSKLVVFFIVEISAISPSAIANSPIQAR